MTVHIADEVRDRLARLEGLISPEVGLRLSELAASVHTTHCIVEIGSFKGKSACYLAAGAQAGLGAPVFCVDPWDSPGNVTGRFGFAARETRDDFKRQVRRAGYAAYVTAFRAFSSQIAVHWERPIGLLYIDGSHVETDVNRDWLAWKPHLVPGGMVCFDDYDTPRNPGVKSVVDGLRAADGFTRWEEGPHPLVVGWLR